MQQLSVLMAAMHTNLKVQPLVNGHLITNIRMIAGQLTAMQVQISILLVMFSVFQVQDWCKSLIFIYCVAIAFILRCIIMHERDADRRVLCGNPPPCFSDGLPSLVKIASFTPLSNHYLLAKT